MKINMTKINPMKFFAALTAAMVLLSSAVFAEDKADYEQVLRELSGHITDSQAILDALKSGSSYEDIQKMLEELKPVDISGLGPEEKEGGGSASMTGSMCTLDDIASGEWTPSGPSVNLEFARLQMELAEKSKNQAYPAVKEIERIQNEQKQVSNFMNQARQFQKQALSSKKSIAMPEDMRYYMDSSKLSYPKARTGNLYSANEWNIIAGRLESRQEDIWAESQKLMIQIQDFMGEYNSYTQGASSSVQGAQKTMQGTSRGQSLFSEQGQSVNTAPIATSMIAGVCIGMLLMWGISKKKGKGTLPGGRP